jgi:15-cis-phytoene synthase
MTVPALEVEHAYRGCERITRHEAANFYYGIRLLPAPKRHAMSAAYAFARRVDDIGDGDLDRADKLEALGEMRNRLATVPLGGTPGDPITVALGHAHERYELPLDALELLIDGVEMDVRDTTYETFDELVTYCRAVAGSVGRLCLAIFEGGAALDEDSVRLADDLGVAMQLTNILRDVGEDARNGRCYLPEEDLAAFGLSREAVLRGVHPTDARWRKLMAFEIARARSLYACAMPGIALLASDSQRCASACAVGYAGILGAIESIGYDTCATRARLGFGARAAVAWNVWRTPVRGTDERAPTPRPPRDVRKVRWA